MKKVLTRSSPPGKRSPAKSKSTDPTVPVLIARIEALAIENSKLEHSLDLTRKQVDMVMGRTIKAEAEREKAEKKIEDLKRENASLVTQLAASKRP